MTDEDEKNNQKKKDQHVSSLFLGFFKKSVKISEHRYAPPPRPHAAWCHHWRCWRQTDFFHQNLFKFSSIQFNLTTAPIMLWEEALSNTEDQTGFSLVITLSSAQQWIPKTENTRFTDKKTMNQMRKLPEEEEGEKEEEEVSLCHHCVFIVFKSVGDILISVGGNFSLTLVKHFTLCGRTTLQ